MVFRLKLFILITISLLVVSCASQKQHTMPIPFAFGVLTYHDSVQKQLAIQRISDLLLSDKLNDMQKAELHYRKARLLDELGLIHLAYFDIRAALDKNPAYPGAYNMLGIYLLRQEEFGPAYEAFDSVLELDPDHDFAYLNRAIALYYGDRPELALKDFEAFYERDKTEPYRIIWWYFAEHRNNPEQAINNLTTRIKGIDPYSWGAQLANLYTGKTDVQSVLKAAQQSDRKVYQERLCEAYFYIAKWYQLQGNRTLATQYFIQAINTHVYLFVEFRYAQNELNRIHLWPKENTSDAVSGE